MKFETINGTLCRMVGPEPLTPEAQFPCVVRLIQDETMLGKANIRACHPETLASKRICSELTDDGLFMDGNYTYRYEIIGYPVEEGSAEWALWQMEQGKKVCHKSYTMKTTHCAINDESQVVIFTTPYSVANGGDVVCHADEWLDHRQYGCGVDERTGWHLYEPQPKPKPKPLLADAKVGDLCKHRNGDWSQIIDTNGTYIPGQPIRTTLKDTNGINRNFCLSGSHFTMQFGGEYDIIATEPLASEGSAEWAWQMLKLGIETKCSRGKIRISKSGMIEVCYDGMAYAMPMTQSPENRQYVINKMRECSPDGWQLYEEKPETAKEPEIVAHKQHANCLVCGKVIEGLLDGHATVSIKRYSISSLYESTYSHYCGKCFLELGFDATERELRNRQQPIAEPEPALKVGDWVEYSDGTLQQAIIEAYSGQPGEQMVYVWHPQTAHSAKTPLQSIIRKLSPSEVIVNIGCLKGTVTYAVSNDCFLLAKVYDPQHRACCIDMSMLDATTRELVESLLKAQEEKC